MEINEKDEMVASIEFDKFQNLKGKQDVKPLNRYEHQGERDSKASSDWNGI